MLHEHFPKDSLIFAHTIWISDILFWDRKAYIIHVILLRPSHQGCIFVVFELTRLVVKFRYFYVKLMSSCQSKEAGKIRNRYNQVPNLTQDTTWESDKNTRKHNIKGTRG